MRTPEGGATFCAGCPMAGEFVGEVEPENFEIKEAEYVPFNGSNISEVMHQEPDKAYAVDRYGMRTNSMTAKTIELNSQTRQDLVKRVEDCSGPTSKFATYGRDPYIFNQCRALSNNVLGKLMNNNKESKEQ